MMRAKKMGGTRHVAHMREVNNAYRILVGMCERKRPFGRTTSRLEDNTKSGVITV
jgi:hypothetical protein